MTLKADNKRLDAGDSRFYRIRRRVYGGLLLFVIVAGLPIAVVPALRNRLLTRVHQVKIAFTGEVAPVMAQAGQNQEPFPAEYERLSPPSVAQVLKLPSAPFVYSAPLKGEPAPRSAPRRTLRIPKVDTSSSLEGEGDTSGEQGQTAPAAAVEDQPKYQKGAIEKEVYDLLLNSNPAVASLVQGSDPALHFITWDAAVRGEDLYWLRLKFRSEGKPDVEYIWQVQLQSKRITPLNYNARAIQ